MSFLLDETSYQKGVYQFLINRFIICETLEYHCLNDVFHLIFEKCRGSYNRYLAQCRDLNIS